MGLFTYKHGKKVNSRTDMFMYKELKKEKSNSKLQIGILTAQLLQSEVRLKEVKFTY